MNHSPSWNLVLPHPDSRADEHAVFLRSNSELGNLLMELEASASALATSRGEGEDEAHQLVTGIGRAKRLLSAVNVIQGASPRLRAMPFGDLLTEILEDSASTLPSAVHLHAQVDQRLPWVRGDPALLATLIGELLSNALIALDGHGLLVIEAVAVDVEASNKQLAAGRYVRLSVEDSGPGLERQLGSSAYEPFVSAWPRREDEEAEHWGLGLAHVRAIAEGHGGSISIYSQPELGTRVMVLLPTCERANSAERPFRPSLEHLPRLEILLVDESPRALSGVARVLGDLGHGVRRAETSKRALEESETLPCLDAAVVALQLSHGESGEELARQLRERFPQLRIVLTSGFGEDLAPIEDQPLPILRKPFSTHDLLRAIQQLDP